ncbi:hypothetical protein PHYBLDRAFT_179967 [Phycomyces blakesleeanus NRRL 1555(-)]|uniref:Uncharacterized protein n=2 Tax=Phycomyces blakesleeanus TaxID=4837 RepID=A0A167PDX7_PHYB8|nr:hypothetical protein PHYBLDRAFT_179967 [Phycomyces blakesleeanus NRRL 1555(-)]OAD77727.1 hypothetical protein PHYBLDRAFT_179967 [Phycomyces blakesleeanus NRRL 1555(-)]|eukprot:XP_018295767.1 hypothetical protein PHYBLDRAFT_179967 [Phycomyces blakesleeanus NRRL 1555(-)]
MLSDVRARIEAHRVHCMDGRSQSHSPLSDTFQYSISPSSANSSSPPSVIDTPMVRTRSANPCLQQEHIPSRPSKSETPCSTWVRPRSGTTGSVHAIPLSALQFKQQRPHLQLATQWEEPPPNAYSIWSNPHHQNDHDHNHINKNDNRNIKIINTNTNTNTNINTNINTNGNSNGNNTNTKNNNHNNANNINSSPFASPNYLKDLFCDILPPNCREQDVADLIRDRLDAQAVRIRRLERSLEEPVSPEDLLDRHPAVMARYRQQVLQDEFEVQKQIMLTQQERTFEALKLKYRHGFDRMVDRVQEEADRRAEEKWQARVAELEERLSRSM